MARRARRTTPDRAEAIYSERAHLYDRVYSFKDYAREGRYLRQLIRRYGPPRARTLLDVGCGTGEHLRYLAPHFRAMGLDASEAMLRVARSKLPRVRFSRGRMETFDLGRQFDVVTCLFSAIGYVRTPSALRSTARRLAAHLAPGGLLIVEPWLEPGDYRAPHPHVLMVSDPDLKLARVSHSSRHGRTSVIEMRYLVNHHRLKSVACN